MNQISEPHERYYDNGNILSRSYFLDGKLDGEFKSWYTNGNVMEQEFYRNGKREGERKIWHDNGLHTEYVFYNTGIQRIRYFTFRKRKMLLKLKRILYFRSLPELNFLIFDLEKMIKR